MHKFIFALSFILTSFFTNAETDKSVSLPPLSVTTTIWKEYVVSERIDPLGEDVTNDLINKIFKGRNIVIDDSHVNINGVCSYEYNEKHMAPLKYWHSQKTVALYRELLAKNNIKLTNELSLITPANPSVECSYPFSYFIKVNNSLVFIVKNKAAIYSPMSENYNVTTNECTHTEQTPDQVYENGDVNVCHYKNMTILETYNKYRNNLSSNEKKHLQDNISSNINLSMKCDNGCITVDYKWNGPDNLIVTQQFDGGETEVNFTKEEQGCKVVIKSFPD
jgi:hypothetical protein